MYLAEDLIALHLASSTLLPAKQKQKQKQKMNEKEKEKKNENKEKKKERKKKRRMQPVLCYVPLDWLIFWFPLLGFRVVSLHNHFLPWLFPKPTHILSHAGWRLITVHFRWKLLLVISVPYTCFAPISKRKKEEKKRLWPPGQTRCLPCRSDVDVPKLHAKWGEEEGGADCICVLTGWIPGKFHLQSAATLCWKVANIPEQWQTPQTCLLPVDLFITHTHAPATIAREQTHKHNVQRYRKSHPCTQAHHETQFKSFPQ